MPKIPSMTERTFLDGLQLKSRGKVRDTYLLPDPELLLSVATDRVSIFDFVLPAEVPQKGEILTALNVFWYLELTQGQQIVTQRIPHDIVAYGEKIYQYLPGVLWNNTELPKRAIVVERLKMIPVEAIVRGYLTGSGWKAYQDTAPDHIVCGHKLEEGFADGDRLKKPIFTPTTKEEVGHDVHMDASLVRRTYGLALEDYSLRLFARASDVALKRGIVIADTKLEFGTVPSGQAFVLGDERFTPDSSRFWLYDDWKRSRSEGRSPVSYDKQFVRDWGKTEGIDKRDPVDIGDVASVQRLEVPKDVLDKTADIYRNIFRLLTGMELEAFQRSVMGI